MNPRSRPATSLLARTALVCCATIVAVVVAPARSYAVDYRLEIVAGSFTMQAGERMILTVATPDVAEVETMLTDPATTAVIGVGEPIVARERVGSIVAGGEVAAESELRLKGPVFRRIVLNDQPAYQLNVPTSQAANVGALRIAQEGIRALRITLTGRSGLQARTTTFLNVVSERNYAPFSVYLVAEVGGAPTLQPDGSTVVGATELERLRALRDLLFRKPPGVPIGVRVQPALIDGLARSGADADRELLGDIVRKLRDNDTLVGTFRPTDTSSYASAGLFPQFEAQLMRGETVIDSVNGSTRTSRSPWLAEMPLNAAAVGALSDLGVTNVIAFGAAVDVLPPELDPSRPYALRADGKGLVLALADPRYATLLERPTGTAYQSAIAIAAEILAQREELVRSPVGAVALVSRRVVLVAASPDPLVTSVVLRLLRRSPQVALRRTSELAPTLDGLAPVDPPEVPLVDVADITRRTGDAIVAVESVRDLLATNDGLVDQWKEIVDVANDTTLSEAERARYLSTIGGNVEAARRAVRLPTSSFTFGSRESNLRISLGNTSAYAVSVRLRLTSPTGKVVFVPPNTDVVIPAGGQREVVVTAQARSNGLIPVTMVLTSPSGTVLDEAEVRIRVNALASLGRGVSALFLVVLGAWWVIHARRNIRRKAAEELPPLRSQA
jgi:hypothetical protein